MTAPSVVEAASALAESRALPTVVREMFRQLLERVAELEAEVAQLRSAEWQQEQIDDWQNELANLRKKREKLYE